VKDKVLAILEFCIDLDAKLDVLTTIELATENDELFNACEEIRFDLVETDSDLLY